MNIKIKPSTPKGRDLGLDHGSAGKGSAPRNMGPKFRENFEAINWKPTPTVKPE